MSNSQRIFAFESLDYVVSYAHQVSTFVVMTEETDQLAEARDEGYVSREVTVEMRDHLWVSPGRKAADQASFFATGSVVHRSREGDSGEEVRAMVPSDGPRLESGRTYVAAFVLYQDDGIAPMSPDATFAVQDGRVATEERHPDQSQRLDGLSLDELRERLEQAEPRPAAAEHMDVEHGDIRVYRSTRDS